jgi:hypothetical protein
LGSRDMGPIGRAAPAEHATRYGTGMTVAKWRERLVCSKCGGRDIAMVVTGARG